MKTEYKVLQFKADEYEEDTGIFSGYAAVFGNVDSGGDIIEPGSLHEDNRRRLGAGQNPGPA